MHAFPHVVIAGGTETWQAAHSAARARAKRHFWSACALIYVCLWLLAVWSASLPNVLQDDQVWYVPTIMQGIAGKDVPGALAFLLDPTPKEYGVVSLNLLTAFVLWFGGPLAQAFLATSLAVHVFSAWWVYRLAVAVGLSRTESAFAGLLFLGSVIHFGVYAWPMAVQHALVVLAVLVCTERYLATERAVQAGRSWRRTWALTLGLGLAASFLRSSVLLLPLVLATHVCFASRDRSERQQRLQRWWPMAVFFLGYPLYALMAGGEPVVRRWLVWLPALGDPVRSYLVLLGLVLTAGGVVWLLLKAGERLSSPRRAGLALPQAVGVLGILGLVWWLGRGADRDFWFSLPGVLLPLQTFVTATLNPLAFAQASDNVNRWNYVPVGLPSDVLGLALAAGFVAAAYWYLRARQGGWLLAAWYLGAQAYLMSADVPFSTDALLGSRWPVEVPSRYFVYLTPPLCILGTAVAAHTWRAIVFPFPAGGPIWRAVIGALATTVLVGQLMGVRVAIFRGVVVNNLLTYDYLGLATLVRDTVHEQGGRVSPSPADISITGVPPPPFADLWRQVVSDVDPVKRDAFRNVAATVFGDRRMVAIRVNAPDSEPPTRWSFHIEDNLLVDQQGRSIDPFQRAVADAQAALRQGDLVAAQTLFATAVERRPFLLRLALGDHPDRDLRYITGGIGLRAWVRSIRDNHVLGASFGTPPPGDPRIAEITDLMEHEMNAYVASLFALTYLARENPVASEAWASRIHLIEQQYTDLSSGQLGLDGLPAPLAADMEQFLRSERFRSLSFPPGRDLVRKYPFGRDLVGIAPGDWPWGVILGSQVEPATDLTTGNTVRPGQFALRDGFYLSEGGGLPLPRWSAPRAVIEVAPDRPGTLEVRLRLVQPDFGLRRERPDLRLNWAGQPIAPQAVSVRQDSPGFYDLQLALGEADAAAIGRLLIDAPAFVPHDREPTNADRRLLGVQIEAIDVRVNNTSLTFVDLPVLPPLP